MTIQLPDTITNHSLYKAVNRCTNPSFNDHYDYRTFYPSWIVTGSKVLTYPKLIKEIFKISEEEVNAFIEKNKPLSSSLKFYEDLLHFDSKFCKDLVYFIFSLPILEFDFHQFDFISFSTRPDCILNDNVKKFHFESQLMNEIEDNEIWNFFKNVVEGSRNFDIIEGLIGMAFPPYSSAFLSALSEPNRIYAFLTNIVTPLCFFIKTTLGKEICPLSSNEYITNQNERSPFLLDLYLTLRSESIFGIVIDVTCTIEVKSFPIVSAYSGLMEGSGIFTIYSIPDILREEIIQMTYNNTNYGVLTDTYTTIILQIDLNLFEEKREMLYKRKDVKLIPLKYKIVNNLSHFPTIRMALFYHFCKSSVVSLDQLRERRSRIFDFKTYLGIYYCDLQVVSYYTQHPKKVIWGDQDSVIQSGICNSQVFKLNAEIFKEFLMVEIEDKKKLVVKVYDADLCIQANQKDERNISYFQAQDSYKKTFVVERLFLQELYEDKEFNSCYIPHRSGSIKVMLDEEIAAEGYFTLFHFIECKPLSRDIDTYNKAKRQLAIIHSHGIIHGDIAKRNILYSQDEKVYIIDFQHSRDSRKQYMFFSKESDLENLNRIFHLSTMINKKS